MTASGWSGGPINHYSVHDGTTGTITLTSVTLSASVSSTAATPTDDSPSGTEAGADTDYAVSAWPITLDISGGVGTTDPIQFMIGQNVAASVNKHGLPDFPSDTYSWSVDGGNPFDYYYTYTSNGTYYPLFSLQDNSDSSMSCYFAEYGTATFTCTMNLAGQSIVLTRGVSTQKPSATLAVEIGTVHIDLAQMLLTNVADGSGYVGIKWTGNIETPSAFDSGSDVGEWNWTQLVTPGRQEVVGGLTAQVALNDTSPVTPVYGVECLDNSYPYGALNGGISTAIYNADGNPYSNHDSPSQNFVGAASVMNNEDSFRSYLMYQPPASAIVVPLKAVEWYWKGNAAQSGGVWSLSDTDAAWSFGDDFPDAPEWSILLRNDSIVYVP